MKFEDTVVAALRQRVEARGGEIGLPDGLESFELGSLTITGREIEEIDQGGQHRIEGKIWFEYRFGASAQLNDWKQMKVPFEVSNEDIDEDNQRIVFNAVAWGVARVCLTHENDNIVGFELTIEK